MNVVDELEKLEQLRSKGHLTQEEFEHLKRQLLTGNMARAPEAHSHSNQSASPTTPRSPIGGIVIGVFSVVAVILTMSVAAYWYLNKPMDTAANPSAESNAATDDIMSSRYGNTTISVDASGQRSEFYYFADHTFRTNTPEGTFKGTWLVEGTKVCFTYETPPASTPNPLCVPVTPHQVGDTWTTGKGAHQITTTIVQGLLDQSIATSDTNTTTSPPPPSSTTEPAKDLGLSVQAYDRCLYPPTCNAFGVMGYVDATSHNSSPITITRVVVNGREGQEGCDIHVSPPRTLKLGDSVRVFTWIGGLRWGMVNGNCGNKLVQVDIVTTEGSSSYTFQ